MALKARIYRYGSDSLPVPKLLCDLVYLNAASIEEKETIVAKAIGRHKQALGEPASTIRRLARLADRCLVDQRACGFGSAAAYAAVHPMSGRAL